jgi:hypothetical protein
MNVWGMNNQAQIELLGRANNLDTSSTKTRAPRQIVLFELSLSGVLYT